jgi:hypothetical protein
MPKPTKVLLEELHRLAKVAKIMAADAVDIDGDGKVDWNDLIAAPGSARFKERVDHLLKQTRRADVLGALGALNQKKIQLRNGRSFTDMSDEELDRYAALRSTEDVLHQAADKIEQDRSTFIAWLVETALPALASALAIVIPIIT